MKCKHGLPVANDGNLAAWHERPACRANGDCVCSECRRVCWEGACKPAPPASEEPLALLAELDEVRSERDAATKDAAAWLDQRDAALRERDELRAENTRLLRERDESRRILATTADRLNTALRESGCCEMIGDHMQGLAIRDGIVALYDKGAQWRKDRDALRAENARVRAAIMERCEITCGPSAPYGHVPTCFGGLYGTPTAPAPAQGAQDTE